MSSDDPEIARLQLALRSKNRHEQAQAAVELGSRGDRESLNNLKAMVNDPDDLVAVSAMFACWQLGEDALVMERLAASLASADEECVQLTVQALSTMGAAVVPKLVTLLDANSPHGPQILRILGDIGGAKAREAVERFAAAGNKSVAEVARAVLDDWRDE